MTGNKKKIIVASVAFALCVVAVGWYVVMQSRPQRQPFVPEGVHLPQYFAKTLMQYDGTNPKLPIYLALDGYVYDVTPGREYYAVGGVYHSLAGKDSSKDLHTFGGSVIKEKYKIVGVFAQ